mgnify:CR=1 FL=1
MLEGKGLFPDLTGSGPTGLLMPAFPGGEGLSKAAAIMSAAFFLSDLPRRSQPSLSTI